MGKTIDYSGESTTVQINGVFYKGKFCFSKDGKPIELKGNSDVTITAYLNDVLDKDKKRFNSKRKVVIAKDEQLVFDLPKTGLRFYVLLLDNLTFRSINNKPSVAEDCMCRVTHATPSTVNLVVDPPEFEPFEVETLHQAYFRTSVKFRPNSASHGTDIYKSFKFWDNGYFRMLEKLRF